MAEHPTAELLRRVALGEAEPAESKPVWRHLIAGCGRCGREMAPHLELCLETELPGSASSASEAAYDHAIERTAMALEVHGPAALKLKERVGHALAKLRDGRAVSVLRDGGYAVYEAALQHSWSFRNEQPDEMVRFAYLATQAAIGLEREGYSSKQVKTFQARSWAELANALRVADRLVDAEWAMARAIQALARGTGDRETEARVFELRATLLARQGRFRLAFELLDQVCHIYLESGDSHLAGRALIKKGAFMGYTRSCEEALRITEQGLALLEPGRDPSLERVAIHNRIDLLVDSGRYREARNLLWRHRGELSAASAGRLQRLRLAHLEGRLYAGLGDLERAELTFAAARQEAAELGARWRLGLLILEQAAVATRRGRLPEAHQMAEEAVEIFVALDVPYEALNALLLLRRSFELAKVTEVQLLDVADFMRRVQNDPSARYELADG